MRSTFAHRGLSPNGAISSNNFSSETTGHILMKLSPRGVAKWSQIVLNLLTTGQILMKLDHNDHIVVGIRIILENNLAHQGPEGRGQMVSNTA